ncbi:unnamed protein product [Adineta steineri]|uniref:Uncharacterized protein n=1 Tax=Adineta steineri TaxID=433720 RepID=A0A814NRK4_9BILA|nr:unnamed protein product [Adineta steineri]CAF1423996.1 unnamed protein product [Adineta steineri]
MMNSRLTYPQLSLWSDEHDSISNQQQTTNTESNNVARPSQNHSWFNDNNCEKQKCRILGNFMHYWSSIPTCLRGLLLGVLIGSLILCVVIPLWLTSMNKTTTIVTTISSTNSAYVTTSQMTNRTMYTSSTSSNTVTSTVSTSITMLTSTIATSSLKTASITASCATPTSTIMSWTNNMQNYQLQTYNYTAPFSGIGVLEFGFNINTRVGFWYLDDVSMLDINASNSEMLVNGNFDGSYCYQDNCRRGYDFLQQTFTMTLNHIYTLSFETYATASYVQTAFVSIN